MRQLLIVGSGGFLGSAARYLAFRAVAAFTAEHSIWRQLPAGTLLVNVVGCFVIGVLAAMATRGAGWSDDVRLLLFTGILGGFTTYSAFALDTLLLARDGRWSIALLNVGMQVCGGFVAVWAGYRLIS